MLCDLYRIVYIRTNKLLNNYKDKDMIDIDTSDLQRAENIQLRQCRAQSQIRQTIVANKLIKLLTKPVCFYCLQMVP